MVYPLYVNVLLSLYGVLGALAPVSSKIPLFLGASISNAPPNSHTLSPPPPLKGALLPPLRSALWEGRRLQRRGHARMLQRLSGQRPRQPANAGIFDLYIISGDSCEPSNCLVSLSDDSSISIAP